MFSSVAKASSKGRVRPFLNNDDGTVAVIFALSLVPLILSMGLAVDLSRSYMARAKLTAALDAAALAVGANPNITPAQMTTVVTNYLSANFPNTNLVTIGSPTVTTTSTTVTAKATANVKTTFMALGGFNTVAVSAQSTVALAKNLEVALVLDNTGSLEDYPTTGTTNIMALKTAAGHLVVTLFGATPANNPQTRVGIVPYVAAVNAGSVASSMVKNPPAYTPNDPTGWTGCLSERSSTFASITPAAIAADLDTPVSAAANNYLNVYLWPKNNSTNPWGPPAIKLGPYTYGHTAPGPNQSCPGPIVPMTNNLQPLLTSIGADASGNAILNSGMEGWHGGGTIGSIGMAWGYRMLSPNGPFTTSESVSNWNTSPWQKAVVLMTDGANNINSGDYTGAPGAPAGNPSVTTVNQQEDAVCDALKAQNVVIYTVYLNSGSPTEPPSLTYCAGTVPGVGDASYNYNAQNQAALYAAFDSIANSLTKLRVTR